MCCMCQESEITFPYQSNLIMLAVKSSSNLVITFLENSHGQQIAKCILEANLYKLSTKKQEN
jgi:hypothetical protein